MKDYSWWKCKFYWLCFQNLGSGLLQIGHTLKKWQWRHTLLTLRHCETFWRCFVTLVKFSYSMKLHVNIITDAEVATIFFYKRLTRNLEIRNTTVWVLPNIWKKLIMFLTLFLLKNVSNKMLLNPAKYEGYIFYRFWIIKGRSTGGRGKITFPPRLRLTFWLLS